MAGYGWLLIAAWNYVVSGWRPCARDPEANRIIIAQNTEL